MPLGVAAGRQAWALFAAGLGVPVSALIPATVILVIVAAVLLAANAVAFGPSRATARCIVPKYRGPGRAAHGARTARREPGAGTAGGAVRRVPSW